MTIPSNRPIAKNAFTSAEFSAQIEQEFIEGSGIHPSLYRAAIGFVSDTEPLPGNDVAYPIHEALNWKQVTRFGHQARETEFAALLLNEDGSVWQAKLSRPRQDAKKGKVQKYETPVGNGSRAYLPAIPPEIRQLISHRYSVDVPLVGSFWTWLEQHSEIPIVWTEGGKKALCLLSRGYVAIALYGVNGGYQKLLDGTRRLIPDVTRFAANGQRFMLAFDQDEREETKRRVSVALYRFGSLLQQAGCPTSVATWKREQGKGIDDLIVQGGTATWERAYDQALPLQHWMILQRLENRLTYPASIKVTTADLSTLALDSVPDSGIVAIDAAKSTGKTKQIHTLVKAPEKVIAAGHRISLIRNLSKRLGLDYKGDLDKVNGEFINGASYTLRVGLCVDSLLAINPEKFRGCDLILDEVVQVLRHLLTSSTCNKDGKRPVLLARFAELVRVARRIIAADADLNNATLNYLRDLRGGESSVFLIRNDYQPAGYQVRFLDCSDQTAIRAALLADVAELPTGKVLFVATDNKETSKAVARLIEQQSPEKQILLINSDTSGGEAEREFIATPDAVLSRSEYDVVIASPSLATGVSIEVQNIVLRVYGIFTGGSSNDADIAQSLIRVRESVERVVWCSNRGRNFCKVSRSTNFLEVKEHLRASTAASVSLIRSNLREDALDEIARYDWQSDPHVNLYCRIAAEQNFSMFHLRDALLVRLKHEGHQVMIEQRAADPAVRLLSKAVRHEIQQLDAENWLNAPILTLSEVLRLEQKEAHTPEERAAIARFHLCDFYCLSPESLTIEDILKDEGGKRRVELLNLEAQLYVGVAEDRTAKTLEKQQDWNSGNTPWDLSHAALRRRLRAEIGLDNLLDPTKAWTKYDLKPYADKARSLSEPIKVALKYTVRDSVSDTQIVHQLLSQMGIKLTGKWSRKVEGHEGEKLRVYTLDEQRWQEAMEILQRRNTRRFNTSEVGSDPPSKSINSGGSDPTVNVLQRWFEPESLADVCNWWSLCQTEEERDAIRQIVPLEVLRIAISGIPLSELPKRQQSLDSNQLSIRLASAATQLFAESDLKIS